MKRIFAFIFILFICIYFCITASGESGKVIYDGNAGEFIFAPGSEYSPTDLFSNFKDVMPGDTLRQELTVRNDADKKVKVKIFIRSLGAHRESADFLSQLSLRVQSSADNTAAYMFDAAASETDKLTDWVYLGTLYSGGEVDLEVTLDIPKEIYNEYSNKIGYLDWEFMVKEFPAQEGDPKAPNTGDNFIYFIVLDVFLCALAFICLILFKRKNK